MGLVPKIVHVDEDAWNCMPVGERSEIIRAFMRDYTNNIKDNLEGINIELLKMKIIKLQNEKIRIDTDLQSSQTKLDNALKAQEEIRIKKLESEKQVIEAAKKCIECNRPIDDNSKKYAFKRGNVCVSCYHEKAGAKWREWSA